MTATRLLRNVVKRGLAWVGLLLVIGAVLWSGRHAVLTGMGRALIAEDPLAPVEVIVVSVADPVADAVEAAPLYRELHAREVVIPFLTPEPTDAMVRALGIPFYGATELAKLILERSGIPTDAIRVLPDPVDGTDTEITAVVADAQRHAPQSLLFITARDHTGRASRQLRRLLPMTCIVVRAPRTDSFAADSWWRSRELSREVLSEYLRWVNTFVLRDPWARFEPSPASKPSDS